MLVERDAWLDLFDAAPRLFGDEVPVEIVDVAASEDFDRTVTDGFNLPGDRAVWFAALTERPSWRFSLATIGGEPAGGGAAFVAGDAA